MDAENASSLTALNRCGIRSVHLEALQELALRISGERSVDAVLQSIVHGLAQQPERRPRTRLGHGTGRCVRLVPHASGLSRSHGLPASLGERGNLAHGRAVVTDRWRLPASPIRQFEHGVLPFSRERQLRPIAPDSCFTCPRAASGPTPNGFSRKPSRALRATHSSFVATHWVYSACSAGHSSTSRSSAGCGCLRTRRRRPSQMRARSQNSTGSGSSWNRTMRTERGDRQRFELRSDRGP